MNCFNHTTEPSVAQCQNCKKGLCINCIPKSSIPLCFTCYKNAINKEKQQLYLELFITFGLGILLTFVMSSKGNVSYNFQMYFVMFYCYSGIVPGWKLLNKVMPNFEFSFSIVYFAIQLFKLMTAIFIGVIALPVTIFITINRLIKLNK